MNFTREPIIETVITPREGCKLVVRSSKGNGQEEYLVEAVEVVSFGHSFFFRSLERPKSFLVPVSDYEILELRETRVALKNASPDRSIKIGGGREAPPRPYRDNPPMEERSREESSEAVPGEPSSGGGAPSEQRLDHRKRDRRRRGRRGGRDRGPDMQQDRGAPPSEPLPMEDSEMSEEPLSPEEVKAPSFISKLFPPPPTLIKETLGRYKTTESTEGDFSESPNKVEPTESDDLFEGHLPKPKDDEEIGGSEGKLE